jgi:hypothetical protein
METLEEANAIGSLFVANSRWHSRQREGWFCGIGQICIVELLDIVFNSHHTTIICTRKRLFKHPLRCAVVALYFRPYQR